jgi:uncharacterized membrane protein
MKIIFVKWLDDVRSSYWFIPALMAVLAIGLAFLLVTLDEIVGADWLYQTHWLLTNRPEGARSLLATIAGSMITVAGVTFSVTISSVVYATSQFGPRLLTNFMQDRGNQVTLGTFIAAFIYCLLVLRTVRSADESSDADAIGAFVPQLAMLGALGLALASVAVLIYFIHHVPATIHISNVIARIGVELTEQIERLCPEYHGAEATHGKDTKEQEAGSVPAAIPDQRQLQEHYRIATPVRADYDGYLQHLDGQGLLSIAAEHRLLIFVAQHPGDFVITRRPLVYVWPAVALQQETVEKIHNCFVFGRQRTQAQDMMFLAQELVEIAVRALSPGVNDPFTAINCMNWLAGAMSTLARRRSPDAYRYDEDAELRVVYQPVTFGQFADVVCDGLRPHAKRDRNAALHLLYIIAEVAPDIIVPADREVLLFHAGLVYSACQQTLDQREDRDNAARRYQQTLERIHDPEARRSYFATPRRAEND